MVDAPPPVFTIGHRESYLKGLVEEHSKGGLLLKIGQTANYPGGIIFQNPRDARRYINEEWAAETRSAMAVFEVKASWEHDCYSPGPEYYWKNLLFDRPIVYLVEES